jgi:hypothetical protein
MTRQTSRAKASRIVGAPKPAGSDRIALKREFWQFSLLKDDRVGGAQPCDLQLVLQTAPTPG